MIQAQASVKLVGLAHQPHRVKASVCVFPAASVHSRVTGAPISCKTPSDPMVNSSRAISPGCSGSRPVVGMDSTVWA